jgi:hypothetical protein
MIIVHVPTATLPNLFHPNIKTGCLQMPVLNEEKGKFESEPLGIGSIVPAQDATLREVKMQWAILQVFTATDKIPKFAAPKNNRLWEEIRKHSCRQTKQKRWLPRQ